MEKVSFFSTCFMTCFLKWFPLLCSRLMQGSWIYDYKGQIYFPFCILGSPLYHRLKINLCQGENIPFVETHARIDYGFCQDS